MDEVIVQRIQEVIDHYGLTISAFADEIGVQRSSISHLLSGRNKPSLDFVLKLVAAFPDVNFYWLLKGEGSFPPNSPNPDIKSELESEPLKNKKNLSAKEIPSDLKTDISDNRNPNQIALFYPDGTFKVFKPKND